MTLLAPALWTILCPLAVPAEPISAEFRRGVAVYAQGKGLERCWMEDRKVLGTWFDGVRRRDVEEAIWLSPSLLSRWMGYAAAREKWTDAEREARWDIARRIADQRLILLVRISSFPKVDPLAPEDEERPDLRDYETVRVLLTADGKDLPVRREFDLGKLIGHRNPVARDWSVRPIECRWGTIVELRGRERSAVEGFPWYQLSPLIEAFAPSFPDPYPSGSLGLFGNYRSKWIWVEADLAGGPPARRQFELRVIGPTKERLAQYRLGNSR